MLVLSNQRGFPGPENPLWAQTALIPSNLESARWRIALDCRPRVGN